MAETELGELVLHDWEFEPVPDNPEYSQIIDKDTEEEKVHNVKYLTEPMKLKNKNGMNFL
jgi:hypothetical protein